MTIAIEPANQALIREQIQALREWRPALTGTKVAIAYGGVSAEDRFYIGRSPASQLSITALMKELSSLGVQAAVLDPCQPSFLRSLLNFDVVMINLHGPYGEDGRLQGMLDYIRKPYCCSGVAASAIAADKALCKLTMAGLGVPTPRWRLPDETGADLVSRCAAVMVKPRMGGSSVGMTLVQHDRDLDEAVKHAAATDSMMPLIEAFVPGLAVTVGLLELPAGVLALPPLATRPKSSDYYDAEAKLDARSEHLVAYGEADLPAQVIEHLRANALKLWDGIGCAGMARIDFIVTDAGTFALEVNTVPGLSYESNFISAASLAGFGYGDVLLALLHDALSRKQDDIPLPVLAPGDLHAQVPDIEPDREGG